MKRTKLIALVLVIQITFIIDLSQSVAACTDTCEIACDGVYLGRLCTNPSANCCYAVCWCNENNNPRSDCLYATCHGDEVCRKGKCYDPATAIKLISFSATSHDGTVILEWATDMEIDNVGFNIWRSETEDGSYIKITDSLIPAQGGGYQYMFTDDTVVKGKTYYYKLEDIDLSGVSTFHGPVLAGSHKGFLPATQLLLKH